MSKRLNRIIIATAMMVASVASHAADVTTHAWYAPYSVTVLDGSTFGSQSILFNGGRADLVGETNASTWNPDHPPVDVRQLSAVFQADPGYAITGVNMALTAWSWGISYLGGSYSFASNWHMDPANPGIDALAYSGCDGSGCIHGNVNGGSGNYDQSYWIPWSGGGREYINIMNPDYLVTLPPTDRFALQFNTHLQVDNANFSVRGLSVQVYTAAIPEPANLSLMLAGLALAGVVIHRRRRS